MWCCVCVCSSSSVIVGEEEEEEEEGKKNSIEGKKVFFFILANTKIAPFVFSISNGEIEIVRKRRHKYDKKTINQFNHRSSIFSKTYLFWK